MSRLTFCDHSLQPDDVGVVKLAHDGCLAQEVPALTLHISSFQRLYCHGNLLFPRCSQATAAHLAKFPWKTHTHTLHGITFIF